jgi:hypothetical protein
MSKRYVEKNKKGGEIEQEFSSRLEKQHQSPEQTFEQGLELSLKSNLSAGREKHLQMLNAARTQQEIEDIIMSLESTCGNRYVQSLMESFTARDKNIIETVCSTEPIEEEEELAGTRGQASSDCLDYSVIADIDRERSRFSLPDLTGGKPSRALVPVDPSRAGGCVIVKGNKFEAWINPSQPSCIVGGIEKHENKHISDFLADNNYKDIPTNGPSWGEQPVPDGETFYYRNNDDAKRFEHAAIDIEIAWLDNQLKGNLSTQDKETVKNRKDVTLPAYRNSFG